MVSLIYGAKGSGKTGRIVDLANQQVENCDGEVVFLTDTEKYMHRLNYNIRLINVKDYDVCTPLGLSGFIRGIIAGNHDVLYIYIDGIHRMTKSSINDLGELFQSLKTYADKFEVNVLCTVSTDTLPDFLNGFECVKV